MSQNNNSKVPVLRLQIEMTPQQKVLTILLKSKKAEK
jgi:hypothetical protein